MVSRQGSYRDLVAASVKRASSMLISGGYSVLAAAALLPILVEHTTNPAGAYGAIAGLLGNIGGNLIANLVQGAYDKARSEGDKYDMAKLAMILERQVQVDHEVSEAIALLIHKSEALSQIPKILEDLPDQWDAFAQKLLEQVKGLSGTNVIVENLRIGRLTITPAILIPSGEYLIVDYLRLLAETTDQLRLGTIDPKFEVENPIRLSQVYVHPNIQEVGGSVGARQTTSDDPLTVIGRLFGRGNASGVVLLGGPGAGKTSLIDRLANSKCLALLSGLEQGKANTDDEPGRRKTPGRAVPPVLPVRVSLQEFAARSLPTDARQGTSGFLWEHIREGLRANALSDFAAPLNQILSGKMGVDGKLRDRPGNGGLILLDGLDEVPRHQCGLVEQTIDKFSQRFNQSVIVVTCRTYSWTQRDSASAPWPDGERHPLARFGLYEIAPFSQEQTSLFVEKWYGAVQALKYMTDETTKYRIDTLKSATKLPSLIPLAEKPLLLTLMATLHTSRGQLPDDRATLYADCVELLLEVWQRTKDLHIGGRITVEGGLLEEFGLSSADVERVLRRTAYDLHIAGMPTKQQPKQRQEPKITAEQLRKAFRPLVDNSWDQADKVVSYLQGRAGLLEYEGDETYSFPHRTFQEFLAACYLLDEPKAPTSLIEWFLSEPTWWGEVLSLAVGRQGRIGYSQAAHILDETLCKAMESTRLASVYATLLNTARDIRLADRRDDSLFYSDLLHRLIRAFLSFCSLTLDSRVVYEPGSVFANTSEILVPCVLPLLEDESAGDAAAVYIGLYGSKDLGPQLISLLEHEEPSVRARAACALGGVKATQAIDLLVRLCREDEHVEVISQALRAMGEFGGDKAISALVDAMDAPDSRVSQVAIETLGRIDDETVISELYGRVEGADLNKAQSIILALSAIESSEAIERLVELLDDEDLSSFAEDALIEIGDAAVPQVLDAYHHADDYELIHRLRYILVTLGDYPLWRERDRSFTDQLSGELQNSDWP